MNTKAEWEDEFVEVLNWFSNLPVREVWHFEKVMEATRNLLVRKTASMVERLNKMKKPEIGKTKLYDYLENRGWNAAIDLVIKEIKKGVK